MGFYCLGNSEKKLFIVARSSLIAYSLPSMGQEEVEEAEEQEEEEEQQQQQEQEEQEREEEGNKVRMRKTRVSESYLSVESLIPYWSPRTR